MNAGNTTLWLNFLLSQWWDFNILLNFYIMVSYTFTKTGFIGESTLKFIKITPDVSSFGMWSLKQKVFPNNWDLHQLRIPLREFLTWFYFVVIMVQGKEGLYTKVS